MLTKRDKQDVQNMITANNSLLVNELMGRIIEVLKDYPTKRELKEELSKLATKEEVNEIKDDVASLRTDLNTFMAFTEERFRVQGNDISIIMTKLNLQ